VVLVASAVLLVVALAVLVAVAALPGLVVTLIWAVTQVIIVLKIHLPATVLAALLV
jgi:hypothetical protein